MAKGKRHNATGRSTTPSRFVQIPYYVLESEAARRLSGTAFKVLVYLLKRHNGVNNGLIAFGARSGCYIRKPGTPDFEDADIGIGRSAMSDALAELDCAGFIRCEKESSFQSDKRIIREYRVTWLPDHAGKEATKEFATATGDFRRKRTETRKGNFSRSSVRQNGLCTDLQSARADNPPAKTAQIIPYSPPQRTMSRFHSPPERTHIVNHAQSAAPQPENSEAKRTQPRAVASKPASNASAPRGPKDSQREGAQRVSYSAVVNSRIAKAALKTAEAKQNTAIDALIADNRVWEAAFDAKHPDYLKSAPYELVSNDPLPDGVMDDIAKQVTAATETASEQAA